MSASLQQMAILYAAFCLTLTLLAGQGAWAVRNDIFDASFDSSLGSGPLPPLNPIQAEYSKNWFARLNHSGFGGYSVETTGTRFGQKTVAPVFIFKEWAPLPAVQVGFPLEVKAYKRLVTMRRSFNFVLAFSTGAGGGFKAVIVPGADLGLPGHPILIITPEADFETIVHEEQHLSDWNSHAKWLSEAMKIESDQHKTANLIHLVSELRAWSAESAVSSDSLASLFGKFCFYHLNEFLKLLNSLGPEKREAYGDYISRMTIDFQGNYFYNITISLIRSATSNKNLEQQPSSDSSPAIGTSCDEVLSRAPEG